MIDNFGLALSHALIIIAVWRLLRRPDVDEAAPPAGTARSTATKESAGA